MIFKSFKNEVKEIVGDMFALMQGNFLVLTLGLSCFIFVADIFFPYESVYLRSLGASSISIGVFFAVNGLVGAVAGMPGGYLCDTYGRRKIIVIGNYLTAFIWIFVALASSWQSYVIAQIMLSIATFWTVAEMTILSDSIIVEKRGLGFSLFNTITCLAGIASPFIGGLILENYQADGLRTIILLIGLADGVKAVIYTKFLKETLETREDTPKFNSFIKPFKETLKSFRLMSRPLLGFFTMQVIDGFARSIMSPFIILYAFDIINLTPTQWGLISTIQLVVYLILSLPGGRLVDRFTKKRFILLHLLIDIPATIAYIYLKSFSYLIILFIVKGILISLTTPAWPALFTDLTPKEHRGKISSLLRIFQASFSFFGSISGGYLYSLVPALPFAVYIVITIITIIITYQFIQEPEKTEQ